MEHTKPEQEAQHQQVLLRSHVERCLQDIRGTSDPVTDVEGQDQNTTEEAA